MRFLLLNTDYVSFLEWLYENDLTLASRSYAEQVQVRADSLFGLADFCSTNLRALGHEAWDIDANNRHMQLAWAREHGIRARETRLSLRLRRGVVPWVSRTGNAWQYDILAAQIKSYKPDVLLNYATDLDMAFMQEMKRHTRLLVGSFASPLPAGFDVGAYDLVLSCVDNFVDHFRSQGVRSERVRFAFEPSVLKRFPEVDRSIPVSFVGNLFPGHQARRTWLEHMCGHLPLQMWGYGSSPGPGVDGARRGTAWGAQMYDILRRSRVTLNHHVDVAGEYAGNIRLFESTGLGALLITDWKKNLQEMFTPGTEVIAYRSENECIEMTRYYLEHDAERAAIARAGQQRTLREHNYYNRMQELVDLVRQYLR